MFWNICFKEYDSFGYLVTVTPHRCKKIKMKYKAMMEFLSGCREGTIREVSFRRGDKTYPSLISDGNTKKWDAPIFARLPLFEYAKKSQTFFT